MRGTKAKALRRDAEQVARREGLVPTAVPVKIPMREGARVWDPKGKQYIRIVAAPTVESILTGGHLTVYANLKRFDKKQRHLMAQAKNPRWKWVAEKREGLVLGERKTTFVLKKVRLRKKGRGRAGTRA